MSNDKPTGSAASGTADPVPDLSRHALFADVPDDALHALAGVAEIKSIAGGDALVHQGDDADALYFVESGRFRDKADQLSVVREALRGFDEMKSAGIHTLDFEWTAGWDMIREREKGKLDQRSPRTTEPQYQTEEDRIAAEPN